MSSSLDVELYDLYLLRDLLRDRPEGPAPSLLGRVESEIRRQEELDAHRLDGVQVHISRTW